MITARMNGATLVEMSDSEFAAAKLKPLPMPLRFAVVGVGAALLCVGLFAHMYQATPVRRVRNGKHVLGSRAGKASRSFFAQSHGMLGGKRMMRYGFKSLAEAKAWAKKKQALEPWTRSFSVFPENYANGSLTFYEQFSDGSWKTRHG